MTQTIETLDRRSPLITMGEAYDIEPTKLMEVLRGTVIKPDRNGREATNEEVAAFVIIANQYGLNPFTREIHAFSDPHKGVVTIVGIDGWTRIANRQPDYDGCDFIYINDVDNGDIEGITCRIFVKNRAHPIAVTEWLAECKRATNPWQTMPRRMLRHKAFMQATRLAFGLAGIYDEDEARDIIKSQDGIDVIPAPTGPTNKRLAAAQAGVQTSASAAGDAPQSAAPAAPRSGRPKATSKFVQSLQDAEAEAVARREAAVVPAGEADNQPDGHEDAAPEADAQDARAAVAAVQQTATAPAAKIAPPAETHDQIAERYVAGLTDDGKRAWLLASKAKHAVAVASALALAQVKSIGQATTKELDAAAYNLAFTLVEGGVKLPG